MAGCTVAFVHELYLLFSTGHCQQRAHGEQYALFFWSTNSTQTDKTATDKVVSLFAASKIMKHAPNPK
jgi:hypothetical protein